MFFHQELYIIRSFAPVTMITSDFRNALLAAFFAAFICSCYSQDYSVLEALGVNCPSRDRCQGYRNNLTYTERSCECDDNCTAYRDCCIDALPRPGEEDLRPPPRTDVKCLHYGGENQTGVYVISKCSRNWTGPRRIRQRCLGRDNFTDPILAVPVTDVDRKITYRNLACAECNNANLETLKAFHMKLACNGLQGLSQEQIAADLTYSEEYNLWGVNRINRNNETDFYGCDIVFDVPEYLNNSVRFCRSDLISTCATGWTRKVIADLCAQYMTLVYSNTRAYRNPHCAICNRKTVSQISCQKTTSGRNRPMSFVLLFDFNRSDGEIVGMQPVATPECPSNNTYDPYFKKCRRLACALPDHVLVNDKCVKG